MKSYQESDPLNLTSLKYNAQVVQVQFVQVQFFHVQFFFRCPVTKMLKLSGILVVFVCQLQLDDSSQLSGVAKIMNSLRGIHPQCRCPGCGDVFPSVSSLKKHVNSPHKVGTSCGRSARRAAHLRFQIGSPPAGIVVGQHADMDRDVSNPDDLEVTSI